MTRFWNGANVMITGVSGTLGSALSRELLKEEYGVARLAGIARKWQPVEDLQRELNDRRFRPFLGDIRDLERLRVAFRGVDYVFHCAALKGVVIAEYNPTETLTINAMGTMNVLQAALDCGVKRVISISSDKACNPLNLYGATKKVGESLTVGYNSYGGANGTRYSSVRYGNVIGSAGSVIPAFLSQKETGTITITHPDMTRFWITTAQAVAYVITCMQEMVGGEIFVPHLPSAPIMDIASAIAPNAKLEMIGIRPGEKMHEIMIAPEESRNTRDYGWTYRILPEFNFWGASFCSGSPVPHEWIYSSASAKRLTSAEIKVIL